MNKTTIAVRSILGLLFIVFGVNGFLGFIPTPPPSEEAGSLLGAMAQSGYFFPVLKIIEIAAGLMLLTNRLVPLAIVLLAAIIFNIFTLHLFLAPGAIGMSIVLLVAISFLIYAYWNKFKHVFEFKTNPEAV